MDCVMAAAAMFWHFREPVMITEGKMQYLYDEKGKRYLDVRLTKQRLAAAAGKACKFHIMLCAWKSAALHANFVSQTRLSSVQLTAILQLT